MKFIFSFVITVLFIIKLSTISLSANTTPFTNSPITKESWVSLNSNVELQHENLKFKDGFVKSFIDVRIDEIKIGNPYYAAQLPSNIVYKEGTAYVLDRNSTVVLIDIANNKVIKKIPLKKYSGLKSIYSSGIALYADYLYIGFENGVVVALSLFSNEVLWATNIITPVDSVPIVDDNKVFVISNNNIVALDSDTGKILFNIANSKSGIAIKKLYAPTIYSGYFLAGLSSEDLIVLRKENGTIVYKDSLSLPNINLLNRTSITDIKASVVGFANNIVIATNTKISVFNLLTNKVIWENRTYASLNTPLLYKNSIIITDTSNNLLSFDKETGNLLWKASLVSNKKSSRKIYWYEPMLVNGMIVVNSSLGEVQVFSTEGNLEYDFKLYSSSRPKIYNSPIIVDNKMLFLTDKGRVYIVE